MKKIFVVVQEAGGAELLSSLIREEIGNYNWIIYTSKESPADVIFDRKELSKIVKYFGKTEFTTTISGVKPDYFFYSANALDSNYIDACIHCKKNRIPTIAFLDHWIDYKERFGFPAENWKTNLPDFIVVGDEEAYKLSRENGLSNILKLNNYYFSDLLNNYQLQSPGDQATADSTLLYISQTISRANSDFTYFGKYEDATITMLLKNFNKIADRFAISQLRIRLHPSQAAAEYRNYQDAFPQIKITIEEPQKTDILISLVNSKMVIGINSMALFIAFLVGKPVISIAPGKISLPLPKELRVNDLEGMLEVDMAAINNNDRFVYFKDNTLASLIDAIDQKIAR